MTINLDTTNIDATRVNDYHFVFTSGSTKTNLDLPLNVITPADFSVDANAIYEISIVNNLLTYQKWDLV